MSPSVGGGRTADKEKRLARRLILMRDGELFRRLGFVRLGDYVVERLGFSYRSIQELMRTEEALGSLPLSARAFDRGEISSGHVRLLTRVVNNDDEKFWVGLARRLSVRRLAAAIEAFKRGTEGAESTRSGLLHAGADRPQETGLPRASAIDAAGDHPDECALERLDINAPAWIASFWRESVTFVRQLLGSLLPQGACLEVVLSEVANLIPAKMPELDDALAGASSTSAGPSAPWVES